MKKMTKTTRQQYNDMLEVLPPEAMTHGRTRNGDTFSCFLVGEPVMHRANGAAVYQSYYQLDDEQHFAGELMTKEELYQAAERADELAEAFDNAEDPAEGTADARILEAIDEHGEDVVAAFAQCFGWDYTNADAITDAYNGQHVSDEDFAQYMAEQLGTVDEDAQWPNNYIDWERAARDLMSDYCEHDGYYFRNC